MNKQPSLKDIKSAIRNKYVWPGGYPLYLICADGEALSIDSARDNWRNICAAHMVNADRQWMIEAIDVNYENPCLYCAHSGERIESAYSEELPDSWLLALSCRN